MTHWINEKYPFGRNMYSLKKYCGWGNNIEGERYANQEPDQWEILLKSRPEAFPDRTDIFLLAMALGKRDGTRTPFPQPLKKHRYMIGNFGVDERQKWIVISTLHKDVSEELNIPLLKLMSSPDAPNSFLKVAQEYANTGFPQLLEMFTNPNIDPFDELKLKIDESQKTQQTF